jgi:hypothetical protein
VHINPLVLLEICPGLLVATSVRNRSPVVERVYIFRHYALDWSQWEDFAWKIYERLKTTGGLAKLTL